MSGVGTGGTITGTTRFIRKHKPSFQAIAVEPTESPVISGGKPGKHKIQGIGAGFIPKNLDTSLYRASRACPRTTPSSGPAGRRRRRDSWSGSAPERRCAPTARLACRPENRGKVIVVIIPSFGERYLSTVLFQGLMT